MKYLRVDVKQGSKNKIKRSLSGNENEINDEIFKSCGKKKRLLDFNAVSMDAIC